MRKELNKISKMALSICKLETITNLKNSKKFDIKLNKNVYKVT